MIIVIVGLLSGAIGAGATLYFGERGPQVELGPERPEGEPGESAEEALSVADEATGLAEDAASQPLKRANERLAGLDIEPISERVSPHSLRRTYASLRAALRDDPVYIAEQLGHEEATFSMSVYAKAVKRRERLVGNYRTEFDTACEWAQMGTSGATVPKHREQRSLQV